MSTHHGPDASLKIAKGIVRSFHQSPRFSGRAIQDSNADEHAGVEGDGESIEVMVISQDEEIAVKHRFQHSFVLIGRSPECDLSLPDDHVSSRHAYLQRIFGRVVCVDLASSNGTYWPDGRRPFGWFDEEHPISIGKYQLRLASGISKEEVVEPAFDPSSFFRTNTEKRNAPKVALQYLSDSEEEESWILGRTITLVGSSSCCKLRLEHESVSRVHCSLILVPEGLWIVDLLGHQGTLVNDESVRSVRLCDGDVFRVGKYSFRVSYLPPDSADSDSTAILHDHALAGKVISNEFAGQLIEQVMAMQQQFLQQSQQQTEMMLQFFSAMHTQQFELLSQEMARVREIEEELRELRQNLCEPPAATAAGQVSRSAEKDAVAESVSEMQSQRRLKHVRTAGPPAPESTTVTDLDEVNWNLSQAAELDKEESEQEITVSLDESDEEGTGEEAVRSDLPELQDVSHSNSDTKTNETNETIAWIDVTESDTESADDSVSPVEVETPDDFEPETMEDEPGQSAAQHELDHHSWVLSRMHQLERERDGIFRKMVKSIFKSNY